ncbi:hypothetical protein [Bacillus marinisedimentorum]|uniref:hypothetical protein n=1 Tax=Bacillus marinisedimentorum TaxID=1821260 RepID=UPI00087329B5|nr:hypothetical protein [Bacillus marinisedimentorum]
MTVNLTKVREKFEQALEALDSAKPFAKSMYQTEVFQQAIDLALEPEGLDVLLDYAHKYDETGVFKGGPWEDASKLQPPFVGGSLRLKGVNSIVELMSELRMLSIAKGTVEHDKISRGEAQDFLNEVMALNLDLLFPPETEEGRMESGEHIDRARRLIDFLGKQLSYRAIAENLIDEIDRLTVQRPIMVNRIVKMIKTAENLMDEEVSGPAREKFEHFAAALTHPTPLSEKHPDLRGYRLAIKDADEDVLKQEAAAFAESMHATGLVAPHHAVLIRHLNRNVPDIVPFALDLSEKGTANFNEHFDLVTQLIQVAIHPPTRQSVYGLARMLDRGVLSSPPVIPGLRRLIELDIHPEVRGVLLNTINKREGITANAILVSGVISVLGQPLGVGQGLNPTCQSARGISLWAQHGQSYLLEVIARAARDNEVDMNFEGEMLYSSKIEGGLAPNLHTELDPVSLVLVPHLDRIYNEMMKKTLLRGEDGHKWVNPEFYGNFISRGFSSVLDPLTNAVSDYPGFVKLFYSTHHPEYNEGHELIYPNPVGIFITNVHGGLLGLHAVSIQRVAKDPAGDYRLYFYNPNNDSGQNWGQGIEPSVQGNGEEIGESSLPFHEFVSRLYAFHYNPYEQGESYMVEDELVEQVVELAKGSWGKEYTWLP